jgi:hypothetical protein
MDNQCPRAGSAGQRSQRGSVERGARASSNFKLNTPGPCHCHWQSARVPEDMALFYSTCDGLHVTWDVVADSPLPLGCMHINKLEDVVPAECLQWSPRAGPQLPRTRLWSRTHGVEPSDDGPGRFHSPTSPCVCRRRLGLVAMVFDRETGPPSFWYLDRCRCWYKLADCFRDFASARLVVCHLGVPLWQVC